jgi:hypothetical protein
VDRGGDPRADQRGQVVVKPGERDELVIVEFVRLQPDGRAGGQRAAVEDEMQDQPGALAVEPGPAHDQQPARGDVEAEFLPDLTAAGLVRRLALLEDPARQRPVVPVVRLDQQHLSVGIGKQRPRGTEHRRQLRIPRGLFGRGEGTRDGIGHGNDLIR